MPLDSDNKTVRRNMDGETGLLIRLLEGQFGALEPETLQKIAHASSDEVETWTIRSLGASNLAQVFADD